MIEDPNSVSSKPVVVRGYIMLGTHIGVFLFRIFLILIVSEAIRRVFVDGEEMDYILLAVFGTIWAAMEIAYVAAILSRASVLDTGDGFEYRTWFSRRHFRDEQVESLSVIPAEDYWTSFGSTRFIRESFAIRLEGQKLRRWDVFYNAEKAPSPITPLMNRLYETYKSRVERKFENRQWLEGKNWKCDGETLQYVDRFGSWQSVTPEQISAVEIVIRNICVWDHDSDDATDLDDWRAEPVLRVPLNGENASFLYEFLAPKVAPKPFVPNRPGVLGRFLYDLKPGRYPALVGCLLMGCFGFLMFFGPGWWFGIFGVILELLSVVFLYVFLSTPLRIRIFDRGFKRIWLSSAQTLYYEDVSTFTYSMVTQYANEIYICTMIELKIETDPESPGPKETTLNSYSFYSLAKEYALILDRLAAAVARRLRRQLDETGILEWFPGVVFHSDRFEYRIEEKFKTPIHHEIPYGRIVGFAPLPEYPDYVACVFQPKEDVDDLHQVPLPKNAPNYMPGYHLLSELVAESRE